MDSQIFFFSGAFLYFFFNILSKFLSNSAIKQSDIQITIFENEPFNSYTGITENSEESQKTEEKQEPKFKNAETNTEPVFEDSIILPNKRQASSIIDPFSNLTLLKSVIPYEPKKVLAKKLLDLPPSNKKKLPLYGFTSPIPKPKQFSTSQNNISNKK